MSSAGPPDDLEQLRELFLRELRDGHREAHEAHSRLRRDPSDAKALGELRDFFHRIAGTGESVGYGMLGRLCASCEGTADLLVETGANVGKTALAIFAEGLAGVSDVVSGRGGEGGSSTPRPPPLDVPSVLAPEGTRSRVLVIDDDRFSARLVDNVLRGAGFSSSFCLDPSRAFETILAEQPDLIILDVVMPGVDGFDLCRRIRQHPGLQFTPIIFVTRKGSVDQRVRGLQVGGNDYVSKPFEPQELVARVRSHLKHLSELHEMAIRDGLTRCYNNKYFKARTEQEVVRARRYGSELTLGMLDIDHFKRVNDTFGHPAGDAVLAHLASLLIASVRSSDVVARFGGEEFGFLLIESAVPEASIITNRLRERIARHEFHIPALSGPDQIISCTVSIGLAACKADDTGKSLLARADSALLSAKQGGRNLVRVAT